MLEDCGYCENFGGARANTACPFCGRVSDADEKDSHLESPCIYCGGNHAIIYCAKYNQIIGLSALYGYEK